jgi:hypothetical protein
MINTYLRQFDATSGFHTTSVLSAPIRNDEGKAVGVIQFVNKKVRYLGCISQWLHAAFI